MNPDIKLHLCKGLWIAHHPGFHIGITARSRDLALAQCEDAVKDQIPCPSCAELTYAPDTKLWICRHRQFSALIASDPVRNAAIRNLIEKARFAGV